MRADAKGGGDGLLESAELLQICVMLLESVWYPSVKDTWHCSGSPCLIDGTFAEDHVLPQNQWRFERGDWA
jgi:hypothetical protein